MYHHFQLNPRTILGVGPEASADQIRDAFREKSKKHHPDLGGDEWAFRMVVRAYEVLKSTANGLDSSGVDVDVDVVAPAAPTSWTWPGPMGNPFAQGWFPFGSEPAADAPTAEAAPTQTMPPSAFQTVDVELIWIRFEMAEKVDLDASDGSDRATLSVCMVVSWPIKSLVARTAEFAGAGETLRQVIDAFEHLDRGAALAVRTRIEDGQFVGWVSYPDVVAAQSAFLGFRDILTGDGLSVRLQTRDEMIPQNWLV
ncbi:J domain-containing protein [Paludisphaera borealis]|uniref:Chaperone protein DnaJ n=1 Tax=Paludisphaera borealis TaxID=1387353 RepID=A0A1U7CIS6_9BACT|nr:J domain-containing protein [Paludisphaera borealis]APW58807.1 Chaperone protein DnaJ [Paludisphaera borealis]